MPKVGTAYVSIRARLDKLERDLADAKGKTIKSAQEISNKISAMFTTAAASFAGAFTVTKVVEGIKSLTAAASDFNETSSKINVLFSGPAKDTISDWAKDSATAIGLSEKAALDSAGSLGYMFQQLGAGQESAAATSIAMVNLSSDFASFQNVAGGAAQVLDAMQSAFRGEYDALQRYIPTINAAAVQHRALSDTGKKSKDDLTDLEKAMAAVAIITDGAGAATGDFSRTSKELANQQRILDSQLSNVAATIGQGFIPILTSATRTINDFIEKNKYIVDAIKKSIGPAFQILANAISKTSGVDKVQLFKAFYEFDKGIIELLTSDVGTLSERLEKLKSQMKEPIRLSGMQVPDDIYGDFQEKVLPNQSTKKIIDDSKKIQSEIDRTDRALNQFFGDLDKLQEYERDFRVDTGLIDYFGSLDEAAMNVSSNIDSELNDFFGSLDELQSKTADAADSMGDAFAGWGNNLSRTLADAVWDSEISFGKIAESFGRMLTQMFIQKQIVEPIFDSVLSASVQHAGGPAGSGPKRTVSPLLFAAAPRLHSGLYPDEFPAILQRGETVIPKNAAQGNRSLQSNLNLNFNVRNETGTDIEVQRGNIIQRGADQIVGDLIIKRKYTSRGFRDVLR